MIGIVCQGGGGKGAWQAGALTRLFELLPQNGHTIGHLCGTSIGAFNVMMAAQHDFVKLRDWWYAGHSRVRIWRGLFRDVDRLFNRAKHEHPDAPRCTAVYTEGSRIRSRYHENRVPWLETFPLAVQWSMRIPGVYLPARGPEGEWYEDGGTLANIDPRPLILDETIDTIIVVFCSPDPWRTRMEKRKRPWLRVRHLADVRDGALMELDRLRLLRIEENNAREGERRLWINGTKRRIRVIRVQPDAPTRNGTTSFNGDKAALDWRDGLLKAQRIAVDEGLV